MLVVSTYDLCAASHYSEARRLRYIPMVIVPSESKVAESGRIFLRASINGALVTMDVDFVRAVIGKARQVMKGRHNYVVSWAKRLDHGPGMLSCRCGKCKLTAASDSLPGAHQQLFE